MRIKSLKIKKYKILKDFEIDFDQDINTHVIIGKNGSGKTTLFEAIIHIFRGLSLSKSTRSLKYYYESLNLQFEIKYYCKSSNIEFKSLFVGEKYEMKFIVNEADYPLIDANLSPQGQELDSTSRPIFQFLPDHLVTYYSGESSRISFLFQPHLKNASDSLRNGKNIPLREFININTDSIRKVLISLLPFQDNSSNDEEDNLLLERIINVRINLKKPIWLDTAKKKFNEEEEVNSENALEKFNQDFYYAEGEVGQFLDQVTEFSQKMYDPHTGFISTLDIRPSDMIDYFKAEENSPITNALDLFKMLDHTNHSDLISDIAIDLRIEGDDSLTEFNNMSEGEHQLKLVTGIKELFKSKDVLFLFDEPDTYLHPEWQIKMMKELNQKSDKHQIITTTHSTTGLSRINKESLFQLQKGKLLPKIQIPIYGADSNLILKDVQNVNNSIPGEIEDRRKGIFDMISNGDISGAELLLAEIESEGVADSVWIRKIRRKIKIEKALKR